MAPSDLPGDSHAQPEPREVPLDSITALTEAIDTLVALAADRLLVFDRDLAEGAWNGQRRAEALIAFLRGSRAARLAIIVHDTRFLETSCPRLLDIAKTYGHAMSIWRTGAEARGATDALVVADGRHSLHRHHADQPRATLALSMPHAARPLVERFDEIWATGEPAIGGSVLGL